MKKNLIKGHLLRAFAGICMLLTVGLSSCFEEPNAMAILDDDDVVVPLLHERIASYDNLTYFAAILRGAKLNAEVIDDKTDIATPVVVNFWNTLSGYGAYTVFAPDNDAIKAWLTAEFPSISQATPEEVQSGIEALDDESMLKVTNMIQYHMCADSIPSKNFVMGKFPYPTLLGSYLLLSTEQYEYEGKADAYTTINKVSHVVKKDIRSGNGYLHIIDKTLEAENRNLYEIINDLGSDYSIFKSIFTDQNVTRMDTVLTKVYSESLSTSGRTIKNKIKYTVFVHNDAAFEKVFKAEGLSSTGLDALSRYLDIKRQSTDERDNAELIKVWANYHLLSGEFYINDLIKLCGASGTVVNTMATNETLGIKYLSSILRLNRDDDRDEAGNFEVGSKFINDLSDMGAVNGVMHFTDKMYSMKVTKAKAVFWDVADQEVINTHPSYRNKNGATIGDASTPDDFFPQMKITARYGSTASLLQYEPAAGWDKSKTMHVYGDRMNVSVGSNRIKQLTITTPTLNKGKYYVWFCFRHQGTKNTDVTLTHNDISCAKTSLWDYWGAKSDADPVNYGYKTFTVHAGQMSCHLTGQIEVVSNGPQTLILDFDNEGGRANWLDMVQFIPIDDNQAWPKFDACGIQYWEAPDSWNTDPWNCPVEEVEDDEEALPED